MKNAKNSRRIKISSLLLLMLFTGIHLTWAAPTQTDIEEQNRKARKEEPDRRQREQNKDVFLQKGKQGTEAIKLPDETPSFTINTIKIGGDEAVAFPGQMTS